MWAIMKLFKLPPTSPLIQDLTVEQRDYIIESMSIDMKEAEAHAKGMELESDYTDNSLDSKMLERGGSDITKDDDISADEIFKQVQEATGDSEYEQINNNRLDVALEEQQLNEKNANDVINQNLKDINDKHGTNL